MIGKISLEGDGEIKEQSARRILENKVHELKAAYGSNWMKEVLKSNGEIAFSDNELRCRKMEITFQQSSTEHD